MGVKHIQFAYDSEWYDRKKKLNATWRDIMEAGIIAKEKEAGISETEYDEHGQPVNGKKRTPTDNELYLLLDKSEDVNRREFDVLRQVNGSPIWKPSPFDEIEPDATFRVRDDGKVAVIEGHKKFTKLGKPVEKEGYLYVKVRI